MMAKTRLIPALAALVLVWGFAANAQEAVPPENCVSLTRLDSTFIVDDQTMLFYMKGKDVMLNSLPSKCPSLRSEGRFMYRVMLNQLCHNDLITVIYDAGFGLMEGPSCQLGKFQPISQAVAEKLRARKGAERDAAAE